MRAFLIGIGVIILALVGLIVANINNVPKLDEEVKAAWSQVQNQYKRRADLIPNLVSTVQGYAKHEKETLTAVIEARNSAISASSVEEKESANKGLSTALKSIFALAESYPDLKANEGFVKLQTQLSDIEEKLLQARKYYNAVIREFNNLVEMFPSSFVANIMHQKKRGYLEIEEEAKKRVDIKF